MNSNNLLSRRTFSLDNKVWRLMFTTIILSIFLLGYKMIEKNACITFSFDIGRKAHLDDSFYYVGNAIKFIASVPSEKIKWDFQDKTYSSSGAVVSHIFHTKGKYYVSANIDGGCETGKLIIIKEKPSSVEENKAYLSYIIGPSSAVEGKQIEFTSPSLADSYQWIILYHPEIMPEDTRQVQYQFTKEGNYVIELTLNKDPLKRYKKEFYIGADPLKPKVKVPTGVPDLSEIKVLVPTSAKSQNESHPQTNLPVSEETAQTKVPVVINNPKLSVYTPDLAFKSHLQALVQNNMKENEFYQYLCDSGSTFVIENGDSKNFSELCTSIHGKTKKTGFVGLGSRKPIQISSVKLFRDKQRCITKIEIKY